MIDISKIFLHEDATIREALSAIDIGAVKIALIVDDNNEFLGTLSDGDIRRGLLNKKTLDDTVKDVYFKGSVVANENDSKEALLNLCDVHKVEQIPIIVNNRIVDLFVLDELLSKKRYKNHVVLMVGGLGTRLRPLTENMPKPMLKVGGKPILQTTIEGFAKSGFNNITMCLGYKSNVIQDYFRNGSDFGVSIDYVVEKKRMGTAGALTLIKKKLEHPFIIMNGDLLTNIDYEKMLNFHQEHNSKATMCVRKYDIEVPYGVVNMNNEKITSVEEKPIHNFFVNAGIYILEPECVDMIPNGEFYDMPELFEKLIKTKEKTISFPLEEYWIDVGRIADYKKANSDYSGYF